MLCLFAALTLTATPAGASGAATARRYLDDFDFSKALSVIAETLQTPGLDTATLVRLYELEGIASATTGDAAAAKLSFARLLTLDPEHAMPGELPPKGRTLYFGAKAIAQREPLDLVAEAPTRAGGFIDAVSVRVRQSSLFPVKAVRITVTVDDGAPVSEVVRLGPDLRATVRVHASRVKWVAELITSRDGVLRRIEHEELASADAPVVVAPPLVRPQTAQADLKQAPPPVPGAWLRPAGIVAGVVGLAGLGVGVALGAQSLAARERINQAPIDSRGFVAGLSQVEAAQLDATSRTNAAFANVFIITGATVAAAGVVMFLVSPREPDPTVRVSLGPGVVSVSGFF